MGYTTWSENLNYSTPERLCTVWPKVFSMDIGDRLTPNLPDYALDYVNNPQKLANTVYASNYGNGDAASGDGFNFRGQGGIHLTFRSNYLACSKYLFTDDRLVTNPLLIQDVSVAMLSAGWFWDIKKINKLADSDSFTQSTKVINGSEASAPDRLKVLNIANTIFI
jgi:putative chitinase